MAEGPTTALRLAYLQLRYQNRLFWRSPIAAFFTLVFPLMLLVLFTLVFTGGVTTEHGEVSIAQFFAPALAVFGAASATYTNLAIRTSMARDEGILKRIRGTPLPPWIYMTGKVGSAVWVAGLAVVLMLGVGAVAYDLVIDPARLPAALLTFAVGVASFAALGLAVAALIPSGEAAPAVANATLLPIAFVSDVFIPLPPDAPGWLQVVGDLFPLKHFVRAFHEAFSPLVTGPALGWDHLGVMALWGAVGLVVALRYFRWEPASTRPRSSRRSPHVH